MKQFDKQFKYSIRKVSVGAASVVIGAFYLAMGAGVIHAETNATTDGGASHSSPSPDQETSQPNSLTSSNYSAEPAPNPTSLLAGVAHSVKEETETKTVTRTIKYVNASDESKEVSTSVTQAVTLERKKGTEEWTRGKWAAQTSPTVEGYNAPDKSIVEAKDVTSSTEDEEVLVYYTNTSSSDETIRQRGRRSKRDVSTAENGDVGTGSTENNEALNSAVTGRRGSILQPNQPGVSAPKEGEEGGDDQHAHLKFVAPDENATVEELYKIIQNMPDDFQNNERSYLHNMDTLGDKVGLEPGEVREITEFGGWHAIDKDGHEGKIGIGKKNEAGLFTGWYYDKDGNKIQGGMLSAGALDEIWVHEQALDRRFKYMLMLAKGRTFANRDEEVKDGSKYTTENPYTSRPTYSPNVVGFNGIEKRFTAFSTAYGSRLKLDFVTGYIGSSYHTRGVYRVVVKAIKKDKADPQNEREIEETIYDHTINEVDGVVDNKELKNRGVDIRGINEWLHTKFKIEYKSKVSKEVKKRMVAYSGLGEKEKAEKKEEINKQVEEELKDSVSWEITQKFFTEMFNKKPQAHFAGQIVNMLYQSGNGSLKNFLRVDHSPENPIRRDKDLDKKPDRFYQLWHYLFPTAKKITYHGDVDQLEIETDATEVQKELKTKLEQKENDLKTATDESQRTALQKEIEELKAKMSTTHSYTYREARDGKVGKPIGSDIEILPEVQPRSGLSVEAFNKFSKNRKAFYEPKGEENFGTLLTYDKFRRTNVLTDEEMSEKIKEVVKNDENNFGRGGYFSTGDIPLDKDVIAYKVAVFSGDDDHVGVLRDTHRVSYNLPILADFSVIQDTTEASKEVARRIIDKMIKEKKIPEETGNKLKKELEKVKKTSEIRNKFFGNVAVKYVDTKGNLLSPKDDKKLGEKSADGTYLVQKGSLVESEYDVTSSKLANITTADKYYTLRSSVNEGWDSTSDSPTGTVTTEPKVVTFVYEESTPPVKGKGVVHFKKQVSEAATEVLTGYNDITLEGDVGTEFSAEEVNTKITELKNAGYEIVSDTFTSGNKTVDAIEDTEGQTPSQEYTITVREKVETVTEPKTPNDPVDPNNEEGPKWPATGLAKSDLEKEVTRTITYVKKETADGNKIPNAQPTKEDKVLYKRTATYNLVSKTVTYSDWTATADDMHTVTSFATVSSPVLNGYVADIKEVTDAPAAPNANGEVTNMTKEVVYTKIGSWVPNIPGKTPTPIPYPNDPDDATKPKYPDYPTTPENPDGTPVNPGETPNPQPENPGGETPETPEKPKTPELPVIPYEPGYTPKIPTDPTQPVDPKTNPLVPLTPVDPKDPKKGYKVPKIPKTPGKDTPITYEADPQKAVVKVFNTTTGTEVELPAEKVSIDNGTTDAAIPTDSVTAKIADLEKRGYVVENKDLLKDQKFDKEKDLETGDPTQVFELRVHEKLVPVTPPTPEKPITPGTPIDPDVPVEPNTPVDPNVPTWTEELINKVKNVEITKEVTRTINYVDESGTKLTYTDNGKETTEPKTDKLTFTREAKINLVTKEITYGEWTAKDNDTTFDEVTSPVVKGYILKSNQDSQGNLVSTDGTRVAASTNLTAASENQTLNVVYTKLGSWVLTPPTGVTPPEGTNFDPKPYPNNPTDPTRPGDPTDPDTPNVPVIPQVPGHTPVVPKDPTKPVSPENPLVPLTPVDPNHPEKGYNVPPVPTTPGQDTPITYVKDGQQKAITSFVDSNGNVLEIPITDTGDSNTSLTKDGEVATTIAKLKAKGYDVVSNDYPSKGTFDNDPKVDQYYKVVLTPHIEPVKPFDPTQPKNEDNPKPEPGTPIDPNNPEGPKWTEALIKQLVTKKEVSRTITYVDEDGNRLTYTANGKETTLPVINKATFTRGARVNAVTGEVTHDTTWIAEGEKFEKVISPVVPGYILKDTNQKEVASETVDQDTEDKAIEVFYKKLGSWVPRIPEGVTPPPGTDLTPKPYPNDPTDPTRPGTDKPKVPTIPGYTPMVPTDPTRPVSPTNPLKPLELTPNGGYEVPNLPTDPSKDIPITYVKDGQKVIVNFVDDKGNVVAPTILESGNSGEKFTKAGLVSSTIEELKAKGYTVESSTYPEEKDRIFDKDSTVDQVYTVTVKPNPDTPKQKAVIKFVVVGEDGKETELVTSRITTTGITGQTIPTNAFTEELKKLTGNPVNNGDYELIDNPLKDGAIFDKEKDEEGKDPSQIFTVKLRQIYVIPPTPRIIERSGGNNTVEVRVPNKDADTLFIKYTEKGKTSNDPKKEIITKKDETGKWKIDKKPEGVEISIDSETGVVSIPSEKIQPKTLVDTQTKHKYKFSKVVSVMPNISDVKEFKGITVWMDESGNVLKPQEEGIHTKEDIKGYESKFVGYEWKESVLEGNKVTHIFKKVSTPTPYTPGEPTPENPTPQPNPEYPSVPTPSPELPNQPEPTPEPETPVSPDPEVPTYETGKREELPNTGTEANAGLASAGIMTLLAGLGLGFFKKKEDEK